MVGRFGFAFLAAALLASSSAFPAVAANPGLTAFVRGAEDGSARSADLRIEAMDVAVRIHGGIAETVVTARLRNDGPELLEGRFTLRMPDSSVVTGYALDVEGNMVDGVLLDQLEARRAYQAQVRRNIDPGLGEVSRDFQFDTRIYPISAGALRTVRVRFVTPLPAGEGYRLPLDGGVKVERLSVSVSGAGAERVSLPKSPGRQWVRGGSAWEMRDSAPDGELIVARAAADPAIAVGAGPDGERVFEIPNSAPGAAEAPPPRRVAILWDRSLSRADDRLREEIALVRAWLETAEPQEIELILFDSSGAERLRMADAKSVARRLTDVRYRGASSYAPLAGMEIEADSCLLVTDGLVTIDRGARFAPSCPVTAVSSAADADRAALAALAADTGGEALRLTDGSEADLLRRLTTRSLRVVQVRSTAGAAIETARLEAPGGHWRLVGPMPKSGGVIVTLAGAGDEVERLYQAPAAQADWSGAAALWAADRLAVRSAAGLEDRETLLAFARRHSVAGPDISFLVLETAEDYAERKIEPPAGFPTEGIAQYRKLIADAAKEEDEKRRDRLTGVRRSWDGLKEWWSKPFDPKAPANPTERARRRGAEEALPLPPSAPPPPAPAVEPPPAASADSALPGEASGVQAGGDAEIAVTGALIRRPNLESSSPITSVGNEEIILTSAGRTPTGSGLEVTVAEWASDRPYLAALRAAPVGEVERVFAAQQAEHGGLPAFWFDVAEFEWKAGRREEAKRLLLSALDLPTRNNETLAIVAERLSRYGERDRAIEMFEAVARAEPGRPQPLRSLALALAKRSEDLPADRARSDLARAIDLLTQVIMTPWDGDYDGIELIALMEVNRLIPRYRALGGTEIPIDPALVALLDVDVRVVIEWNTEETDLDLWVDEPNGERAYFNNDETRIGGRISNDMTDGYGPEEYLLRRAPDGTFTIRADVYSSDELNPNGASRITARLIRNFGRPGETEEAVEIELLPARDEDEDEDDDVKLIGKIRIRR